MGIGMTHNPPARQFNLSFFGMVCENINWRLNPSIFMSFRLILLKMTE